MSKNRWPDVYQTVAENSWWVMNTLRLLVSVAAILILAGCAILIKPPPDDENARRVIAKVLHHNTALASYKALANVSIQSGGRKMGGRVALAAALPDRMRLEWLSAIGQPVTRLVGDGSQISIAEPGGGEIRQIPQTDRALESIIHLPVGIAELQSLITGRAKLPDFVSAQIQSQDDHRVIVALMDRWYHKLAKVEVSLPKDRLQRVEYLDKNEKSVFVIHWKQWQQTADYEIPKHAVLSTPAGHRLSWTMVRFWPNVELPVATFELQPPPNQH